MFKEARIKLTAYYLVIIMAVSLIFSIVIYKEATIDLDRIERFQRFTSPVLDEVRDRIVLRLVYFNLFILVVSGGAGYYLAGKTLEPIQVNMDEQKDFVANASHELRTPLTALKTELEITLRDPKVKNKEILKSNLEEVNKMKKLTDYLLKQSRFQSIETFEKTKVSLNEVAEQAIGKIKVNKNLNNVIVYGDKDSLTELVTILVDNAKKYGGNKKVPEVTTKKNYLEVKDFGVGIPPEDIPHIFEKFYRGDKARGADGYGLGLAIAKQIADAHGAKIKVESRVSEGTTFRVIFT